MSRESQPGPIPIARLEFDHAASKRESPARRIDRAAPEASAARPSETRIAVAATERNARIENLQERLREHCRRHRGVWIGREFTHLLNAHGSLGLRHPTPRHLGGVGSPILGLQKQAQRNVEVRITRRLSRLNVLRQAQSKAEKPTLRQAFRKTITP